MPTITKGRHTFAIPTPAPTQRTVSFGIWPIVDGKTGPKKGKSVVSIRAPRDALDAARLVAEYVRDQLDAGTYKGHKHIDLETGTGRRLLMAAQHKAGVVFPETQLAS